MSEGGGGGGGGGGGRELPLSLSGIIPDHQRFLFSAKTHYSQSIAGIMSASECYAF